MEGMLLQNQKKLTTPCFVAQTISELLQLLANKTWCLQPHAASVTYK